MNVRYAPYKHVQYFSVLRPQVKKGRHASVRAHTLYGSALTAVNICNTDVFYHELHA
jgi:hypothetical protein